MKQLWLLTFLLGSLSFAAVTANIAETNDKAEFLITDAGDANKDATRLYDLIQLPAVVKGTLETKEVVGDANDFKLTCEMDKAAMMATCKASIAGTVNGQYDKAQKAVVYKVTGANAVKLQAAFNTKDLIYEAAGDDLYLDIYEDYFLWDYLGT